MRGDKDINEQVETLQSQAKTVMNETAVPVDERIQRAADIYRQAEKMADENDIDDKIHESLLSDSARFFYDFGMYKEALSRYTILITMRETLYGQDHAMTATAYHDIGEVYRNLCYYLQALEYNIKALDIRKKLLGEKHVDTAESYNDTGLVYIFQGKYDKASELFQKAKTIYEEVVGLNHLGLADTYMNIGMLFLKQEDHTNALENYSEALKICGPRGIEDRQTAIAYYGIGLAYYQMGNNSNALDYCSKAVRIYENIYGLNHPEIAIMYTGIGYVHYNIGGLSQALDYFTKSLEISEKMLGYEHINTAYSYCALGLLKYKTDDNQEALECFEKYLNIIEKILGLEHPDTAEAYYNMGMMYYFVDDNIKAYEYYVNALEIYKKCTASNFINEKIKMVESDMSLIEVKPEEESKGTRDLFLETLTKIGCQYEIDPEDEYINFAYQGENFVASANNEGYYVRIWDTYWGHVELYNVDEFSRLRKAINHANLNCATMTVYTINEEGKTVDVHCKSVFPFISQMPDLEDYLRNELGDFFTAHHLVGNEMAKLREQEENVHVN